MSDRADRYNAGKAELHYLLTFPEALCGVAAVTTYGARKYSAYNYLKGAPVSEHVSSAMRHLLAYFVGEDNDPESGLHHLHHFAWNALRLADEVARGVAVDDRPDALKRAPLPDDPIYGRTVEDLNKEKERCEERHDVTSTGLPPSGSSRWDLTSGQPLHGFTIPFPKPHEPSRH